MPERVLGQRDMDTKLIPEVEKHFLAAMMLPALIVQGQVLCVLKHIVRTDKLIETISKIYYLRSKTTNIKFWFCTERACFNSGYLTFIS